MLAHWTPLIRTSFTVLVLFIFDFHFIFECVEHSGCVWHRDAKYASTSIRKMKTKINLVLIAKYRSHFFYEQATERAIKTVHSYKNINTNQTSIAHPRNSTRMRIKIKCLVRSVSPIEIFKLFGGCQTMSSYEHHELVWPLEHWT